MSHNWGLTVARNGEEIGAELMEVAATDAAVADPQLELARAGLRLRRIVQLQVTHAPESNRLHDRIPCSATA